MERFRAGRLHVCMLAAAACLFGAGGPVLGDTEDAAVNPTRPIVAITPGFHGHITTVFGPRDWLFESLGFELADSDRTLALTRDLVKLRPPREEGDTSLAADLLAHDEGLAIVAMLMDPADETEAMEGEESILSRAKQRLAQEEVAILLFEGDKRFSFEKGMGFFPRMARRGVELALIMGKVLALHILGRWTRFFAGYSDLARKLTAIDLKRSKSGGRKLSSAAAKSYKMRGQATRLLQVLLKMAIGFAIGLKIVFVVRGV